VKDVDLADRVQDPRDVPGDRDIGHVATAAQLGRDVDDGGVIRDQVQAGVLPSESTSDAETDPPAGAGDDNRPSPDSGKLPHFPPPAC
jgi:hypothetical protein